MNLRDLRSGLSEALYAFLPPHLAVTRRDLWIGSVGMAIGLVLTDLLCRVAGAGLAAPSFIASMGATAMLVFFMPASPMAQPWPVVGGNLVSALLGVVIGHVAGEGGHVAALAAACATAVMFALRCLHPPGAAVAMTAVMGGPAVHAMGWRFAAWPVAANAVCLVFLGLVLNNAAARRYPHHHRPTPMPPAQPGGITGEDIDAALDSFDELLDVEREDIEDIIRRAESHARARQAAGR